MGVLVDDLGGGVEQEVFGERVGEMGRCRGRGRSRDRSWGWDNCLNWGF